MKLGTMMGVLVLPVPLVLLAVAIWAAEAEPKFPEKSQVSSGATPRKAARAALAGFEKANGDWKVRMDALVRLAQIGPAAAPVLLEALKDSKPGTREFAAQALV